MNLIKFGNVCFTAVFLLLPYIRSDDDAAAVANANNQFAWKFLQTLRSGDKSSNTFFSPISISLAIAMTSVGAAGDTLDQINNGMSFPEQDKLKNGYKAFLTKIKDLPENVTIDYADRIYVKNGFKLLDTFLNDEKNYFNTSVENVDFSPSDVKVINNWVSSQTNNKINDLIPEDAVNSATTLILINCIYFLAQWDMPFDDYIVKLKFNTGPGKTTDVDSITVKSGYDYADLNEKQIPAEAVAIPFKDNKQEMIVILPNEDSNVDTVIDAMIKNYGNTFSTVRGYFTWKNVEITMPMFKLTIGTELKNQLKNIGIVDMFDNADFSKMDGQKDLSVSAVIHKAYISVDRNGVEAAAATAVIMEASGSAGGERPSYIPFTVNRPFIIALYDKNVGTILFSGAVVSPVVEK